MRVLEALRVLIWIVVRRFLDLFRKSPQFQPKICIIGAGLSGIGAAVKLLRAGYHNIVILERNPEIGGTWWENRYPGLSCDTPMSNYSFSFPPFFSWSERYPSQVEILQYLREVCRHYDINELIQFSCEVRQSKFKDGMWHVETDTGVRLFDFLVIGGATSQSEPVYPKISGLSEFSPMMHSARWDPSVDLVGKNVGVIGNAASGIQIIPEVARVAKKVTVFQRNPNWVVGKPRDPSWLHTLLEVPGFWILVRIYRWILLDWSWAKYGRPLGMTVEEVSAHMKARVDPSLHDTLIPKFPLSCKRVLQSNEYLSCLNQDNVELCFEPAERVNDAGVFDRSGKFHPTDVLVCATGFTSIRLQSVIGSWGQAYASYLGILACGHPNLFMILGPSHGLLHFPQTAMIEYASDYFVECLRMLEDRGARYIWPRFEAQREYQSLILKAGEGLGIGQGCGYHGKSQTVATFWPFSITRFWLETRFPKAENLVITSQIERDRDESDQALRPIVRSLLQRTDLEMVMPEVYRAFSPDVLNELKEWRTTRPVSELYSLLKCVDEKRTSLRHKFGKDWARQLVEQKLDSVAFFNLASDVFELIRDYPLLLGQNEFTTLYGPRGFQYPGFWTVKTLRKVLQEETSRIEKK